MKNSGPYARVREYDATKTSLSSAVTEPVATWPSNDFVAQLKSDRLVDDVEIANKWNAGQSQPVYADIHEVAYSEDWVYVRGSGLPSYEIGPCYERDTDEIIGNWPENEAFIYRFPRHPTEETGPKRRNDVGAVGK
jgi:hypothetical protein